MSVSQKSQTWDRGLCASGTEDRRKVRTNRTVAYLVQKMFKAVLNSK